MKRVVVMTLVAAAVVGVAGYAVAQSTAGVGQIVREIEQREFPFDDVTYRWEAKLRENGRVTREFAMKVYTKGSDKILVQFTSPGEVAGMGILQLGARTMYMFNPEDDSVRLIATSARGQGLLGTDYAPADAGFIGLVNGYTATLLSSSDSMYKVELVPNSADVSPYSKLVMEYDRQHRKATKIECYEDGVLAKTITRDRFETHGDAEHFARMTVQNNQVDRVTEMTLVEWSVNDGLEDRLFTKRTLMMGL